MVPNSNLVSGVVTNWVRSDRVGRIKIPLTFDSSMKPDHIREVLLSVAKSHEQVLKMPAPQVMFLGMTPSALNFELWCFVADVETSGRVRSDLHFELHRRLAEAKLLAGPPAPTPIVNITGLEKLEALLKPQNPAEAAPVGEKISAK
jgi:small-conductance mechanosensitive channel